VQSLRGTYIAFEGVEGTGKSTQARMLAEKMSAVLTRENGGTPVGAAIREITHGKMEQCPRTEALLFAADRAQHIEAVVKPALAAGRSVVSDRSLWSSIAYQGFGRGLDPQHLFRINQWATSGVLPDIVIVLTCPTNVISDRLAGRARDRIEQEGSEFFDRADAGFRKLSLWAPGRWIQINADQSVHDVSYDISRALAS
jgi:dTMP kinase